MHGRISVIINAEGALGEQVVRAARSLRNQTMPAWEGILTGTPARGAATAVLDTLPAADSRLRWLDGDSRGLGALASALRTARSSWVLVLDPYDELRSGALAALVEASRISSGPTLGRYVFRSRIGPIPGDPLEGIGSKASLDDWLCAKLAPLSFQLLKREALLEAVKSASGTRAGDWSIALEIAKRGATWGVTDKVIGRAHLRPLAPMEETLQIIADHFRVLGSAWSSNHTGDTTSREDAERPWIDAFTTLVAFEEQLKAEGPGSTMDRGVRFGNLYATWWQRLGFFGRAPAHVFCAYGGVRSSCEATPQRLARRLVRELDLAQPIELLGLGRNARELARALREHKVAVRGRDDNLVAAPAWATEEGVTIELIGSEETFDPSVQYVMTVRNDASYLSTLPEGLRILRWNDGPRLLLADGARALASSRITETKPRVRRTVP